MESSLQSQNDVSARIQDLNSRTFADFDQKVDSIVDGIKEERQYVADRIVSSTQEIQQTISGSLKSLADSVTKLTESMAQSQAEVLTLLRSMSCSRIQNLDSKTPSRPLSEVNLEAYEKALNRRTTHKHKNLNKKGY